MTDPFSKADLNQFTGTTQWYRHAINRRILYTEGVQYLAEKAGAYWLLDEIALIQPHHAGIKAMGFQLWTLRWQGDHAATLTCGDGDGSLVYSKEIPFTDFPLPEITLYVCEGVILLPSEY